MTEQTKEYNITKKLTCWLFGHDWKIETQTHTCDGDYSAIVLKCQRCGLRELGTRYNR